jgi:hypothetical protein
LLVLGLLFLGFACACITDHPGQAIDRALSAIPAVPPVIEIWSLVVAAASVALIVLYRPVTAGERASPAVLQRFLF